VAPPLFGLLMNSGLPAVIFWIAVGLYTFNAGMVMLIRNSSARKPAYPAAAE
jgi:hypothetical protein